MKNERGFSLLELLIVVVILGIIMAVAVPGLKRAKQNAHMGSAIQSLRTITTAQNIYERKNKVYASLTDLVPEGSIDGSLGTGVRSEYRFDLTLNATATKFSVTATPLSDAAYMEHFFVDDTAVIRFNTGSTADANSPPIPR